MSATLLDFPDIPMEEIIKNCDELHLHRLQIEDIGPSIRLEMVYPEDPATETSPYISLNYYKTENGCKIRWTKKGNSGEKIIEGINYMEKFLEDYKVLVGHPKLTIGQFSVRFSTQGSPFFAGNLEEAVLKSTGPICAETLRIEAFKHEQVMKILPYSSPDHLKFLDVDSEHGQFMKVEVDQIICMNQWKKATQLDLRGVDLSDLPIQEFAHFKRAKICYGEFDMECVKGIIKMFRSSTTDEKFFMIFPRDVPSIKTMSDTYGDPIKTISRHRDEEDNWYFGIPENAEKVVELKRDDWNLYFKNVGREEVPKGAVVRD